MTVSLIFDAEAGANKRLQSMQHTATKPVPALLCWHGSDSDQWLSELQAAEPGLSIVKSSTATKAEIEAARVLFTWRPAKGLIDRAHNIELIVVLGAGIDGVTDLPQVASGDITIARIEYSAQSQGVVDFALAGALHHARDLDLYEQQQDSAFWQPLPIRRRSDVRVGVLGLGAIGSEVAGTLGDMGFSVSGWSRSNHHIKNVHCTHGLEALNHFLAHSEVLINVLPSTHETNGLLTPARLNQLPKGASFINVGRGDVVHEADLLAALKAGVLRSVWLDVFKQEPLSPDNLLWSHPRVRITPHVASRAQPAECAAQLARDALQFIKTGSKDDLDTLRLVEMPGRDNEVNSLIMGCRAS